MLDIITGIIRSGGLFGIAFLTFAENVFPPIPSELILPLAGFVAVDGDLTLPGIIIAGSIGSLAGAVLWYYIGVWVGADRLRRLAARHGRWVTASPEDLDRALEWFKTRGGLAVFLCRMVPGLRTYISLPAGFSRMPMGRFVLYSAAGTVIWTSALVLAGYWLENAFEDVEAWLGPVTNVVVVAVAAAYLWRVLRYGHRSSTKK